MQKLRIGIVAGESSGDYLGAKLIKNIKAINPAAEFIGIAGPQMRQLGAESLYPMEKLSVMGFSEVLGRLFELLRIRKNLYQTLLTKNIDCFIGIDAPDFNFKLEQLFHQKKIKAFHLGSPSIWAWRKNRINKIKKFSDGMLLLFPFEKEIYDEYKISNTYVGHPLMNEINYTEVDDNKKFQDVLKLKQDCQYIAILPGSRMAEVNRMLPVYLKVMELALKGSAPLKFKFLIPCVNDKVYKLINSLIANTKIANRIILIQNQAKETILASQYAVVTSGTAVLQTALLQRPQVVAIKVSWLSYLIMRMMIISKWVSLPNIILKQGYIKELIQHKASAENIFLELKKLIEDKDYKNEQLKKNKILYESLGLEDEQAGAKFILNRLLND